MCHATLHVSNLPCKHRYYKIVSPCSPSLDLSTCPNRITLDGWEQREDYCPFCSMIPLVSPMENTPPLDSPISAKTGFSSGSGTSRRGSGNSPSGSRRASAATVSSTYSSPGYDSRIYRVLSGPPVEEAALRSLSQTVLPGSRAQLRRNSSSRRVSAILPDVRSGNARVVGEEHGGVVVRVRSNYMYDEKYSSQLVEEPATLSPEDSDDTIDEEIDPKAARKQRRSSWMPSMSSSGGGKRNSIISIGSTAKKSSSKWLMGIVKT